MTICPQGPQRAPIIERAYQIARTGKDSMIIREMLHAEGYEVAEIASHLSSRVLAEDLKRIAAANKA